MRPVRSPGCCVDVAGDLIDLGVPVLGICYGAQLMAVLTGGQVLRQDKREYGRVPLRITGDSLLWNDIPRDTVCWMSHTDQIDRLPPGFTAIAATQNCPVAAMADENRALYAVQFHPEVQHTPEGARMLPV